VGQFFVELWKLAVLVFSNPIGIVMLILGFLFLRKMWGNSLRFLGMGWAAFPILFFAVVGTIALSWFFLVMFPNIAGFAGQTGVRNWTEAAKKYNVPFSQELPDNADPFSELTGGSGINGNTGGGTGSGGDDNQGGGQQVLNLGKYIISHTSGSATVRNKPGGAAGGGNVLQEVQNGTTVTVSEFAGDWAHITSPLEGWLSVSTLGAFQGP